MCGWWRYAAAGVGAALTLASTANAADLTLRRVTLSLGGVGYFEYGAEVDGDATLGLDLRLDQVSDALNSLVVLDAEGSAGSLVLPGEQGAAAAFATLPFGPDAMRSALAYMNGLQGVEIEVHGRAVPGGQMTGRILRAERDAEPVAGAVAGPRGDVPVVPRTRVSVLTAGGLRQFVLEDADSVQVTDPALRTRIGAALGALLAQSGGNAGSGRRHLLLRTSGHGPRDVRVGMVLEAPLWKATYRLVLPSVAAGGIASADARLQGWAVLENATATDWSNVAVSLQSGNPVTFRQDIYRQAHVIRPLVPVEVMGRILPDVDTRVTGVGTLADSAMPPSAAPALASMAMSAPRGLLRKVAPPGQAEPMASPAEAAQVSEGAEDTVFGLPQPLSLAAGETASVPILDGAIRAERIGLLTQGQAHPLAAVRVHNDTGHALPPGVVATYGDGGFSGNARLGALPTGEQRLLSFAQDLRTTADWTTSDATTLTSVAASGGVLHVIRRSRTTIRVALVAPAHEARNLLLALPRGGADATLSTPAISQIERTATDWRVPVTLKAGETRQVTLYVDRMLSEQMVIGDDAGVVVGLLGEAGLPAQARAALEPIARLRQAESDRAAARDRLTAQHAAVEADEERLRKNLAAVSGSDALHGALLRQLEADEGKLAALSTQIASAGAALDQAHQSLLAAVAALSL